VSLTPTSHTVYIPHKAKNRGFETCFAPTLQRFWSPNTPQIQNKTIEPHLVYDCISSHHGSEDPCTAQKDRSVHTSFLAFLLLFPAVSRPSLPGDETTNDLVARPTS
jgi:hypothetical protein